MKFGEFHESEGKKCIGEKTDAFFQRVKKLLRRFLTRWETLKKECRFRQNNPKSYIDTSRGYFGEKQKISI
ncbi:MAG: hypothetical protein IJN80_04925 [Clostridia bacterium]|nr:hypothetical protein [Clostridia bacterium]